MNLQSEKLRQPVVLKSSGLSVSAFSYNGIHELINMKLKPKLAVIL